MKKKILIAIGVVVVLLVVGGILLLSNLDKIVKIGVEEGGTMVLGVPVQLEGATVAVREGTVGLDGLKIGSPEGFEEVNMFNLDHAHTTVDIGSLRGDEIVVKDVVIDGALITLEFDGGKTNWGALLKQLEGEPKEEEAKKKSQKNIRIDRIVFTNGKIRIAGIPLVGSATVPLPTLEITDLAPADGTPSTVGNVLADVVRSLYKSILAAAGDVLPTEQVEALAKEAGALLGEAGAAIKDAGAKVGEAAGDAAKNLGDKAGGVIKGLFGDKKDEEEAD
jgi:hypothetical protein